MSDVRPSTPSDHEPEVWVECPDCGGEEGWVDGDDVWHECPTCEGYGGHPE